MAQTNVQRRDGAYGQASLPYELGRNRCSHGARLKRVMKIPKSPILFGTVAYKSEV